VPAASARGWSACSGFGDAISISSCRPRYRRVDLQVARIEVDALAKSYGLTQATRFINLLEISGIAKTKIERETGERFRDRGFEVEFQVPLFDFGEVRVRQAEQTYMQAINRLVEKAVNVRSEARDAYRGYRSAYDIAGHYQREILPLRKIISDETLLRYNAMQIDVFDLLAEARQRIVANTAAIDAKRSFWLATTDLKAVVAGGGTSGGRNEGTMPMAESSGETGRH
jgi:outer membrane protein TolC